MSLSPVAAERLKEAFQQCRDMEGTLSEQLEAYAAVGREVFPAYGEAVDRLVARIHEMAAAKTRRGRGRRCRPSCCRTRPAGWSALHRCSIAGGSL